jgi:hypothetical protein
MSGSILRERRVCVARNIVENLSFYTFPNLKPNQQYVLIYYFYQYWSCFVPGVLVLTNPNNVVYKKYSPLDKMCFIMAILAPKLDKIRHFKNVSNNYDIKI